MGLFDRVRLSKGSKNEVALGPAEAFAGIALIVIGSDGHIADSEVELLIPLLRRMHLFRSYPSEVLQRMFDKLVGILRRQGIDVLMQAAIQALPHDLYDTVFAVATDLILADGEVTEEEENLLSSLCEALEISDEIAQEIIRVMLIKNKG
ncbi:conserved hypothetical protein [Planktothrix serta PCC 8927]|uniref:Co-chaperone DjlA N-terminal domain-containing protein n=1 Tax=Planktothrix serta PCC 8927 TaxID=671068 RepID=A0A7Z9BYB4_9CYAN|nr:tellurite resistance TerB family protein [Planktothrix serta]VXD21598.1 conserved hypothetical protein [Planktothrix serta PCC 8927]